MKNLFQDIVEEYKELLGKKAVFNWNDNTNSLRRFFILYPNNVKQVQSCLKIANKYKLPIYPISAGKNWGYQYKISHPLFAYINLSNMNRIIDFNEELGYVTIEPGVTYDQLYRFLQKRKSNLMLSTTGATSQASLVAHAIERGIGKGIYSNSFYYTCGFEIVLPNSQIINTGYAKYKNAQAFNVSQGGSGPLLEGLFTQSNMGIVTKLTLWLQKRPGEVILIYYYLKNDKKIPSFISNIQRLKKEGLLQGNTLFANVYRIVAELSQYPWKETNMKTPLPVSALQSIMKTWEWKGKWYGDFMISSSDRNLLERQARIVINTIRRSVDGLQIIDRTKAEFISKTKKIFTSKEGWTPDESYYKSVYLGHPTEKSLKMLYWRKRSPMPKILNPEKDKCGIMWVNTELPFHPVNVKEVNSICTRIMKKRHFEPNIIFNFISERALLAIISIVFDQEVGEEVGEAGLCKSELLKSLANLGYFPYRNGNSNELFPFENNSNRKLIKQIKNLIDPNNIISPERNN